MLEKIKRRGVQIARLSLAVGFGTFTPVRTINISEHRMEAEHYELDKENADIINRRTGRLICVGTTAVRALESITLSKGGVAAGKGWSDL